MKAESNTANSIFRFYVNGEELVTNFFSFHEAPVILHESLLYLHNMDPHCFENIWNLSKMTRRGKIDLLLSVIPNETEFRTVIFSVDLKLNSLI